MIFFSGRLGLSLAICNIVSAGISFLSIIFYSWYFSLANIGNLATVTSASMLLLPLITFRLDLAFQRLPKEDRPSLSALILSWAMAVAVAVAVAGIIVHRFFGWQSFFVTAAIPVYLLFSAANSVIWAQKVCDRNLRDVAVLQIVRSLLAAVFPFALSTHSDGATALISGQILAQLTFILFLPPIENFRLDRMKARFNWVVTEARDLVVDNTLPLLINSASLNLNPVLAAMVFGPEAAAVVWLIFRLFLTPASMISDPVRRDFYANFTDGRVLNRDPRRAIFIYKISVIALAIVVLAGVQSAMYFSHSFVQRLGTIGSHPLIVTLGLSWALAVLFNAPSTGLVPVLRLARIQTGVETIGLIGRVGSLLTGLLGLPMTTCLYLFLGITIGVNLTFGVLIDWHICRRTPPGR